MIYSICNVVTVEDNLEPVQIPDITAVGLLESQESAGAKLLLLLFLPLLSCCCRGAKEPKVLYGRRKFCRNLWK